MYLEQQVYEFVITDPNARNEQLLVYIRAQSYADARLQADRLEDGTPDAEIEGLEMVAPYRAA